MSLLRCSGHGTRQPGALTHVYWFMPRADGTTLRKRQRLCSECYETWVVALLTPDDVDSLTCPACGISTDEGVDPIYVTYYPPRSGSEKGAMAFCAACAIEARLRACHNADDLPDRYVDSVDMTVFPDVPPKTTFTDLGRQDPGQKHAPSVRTVVPFHGSAD